MSVKIACSSLLAPKQLGLGVAGGAEEAVRAARQFLDNMQRDQLCLKIYFRNLFNTLRSDAILEAIPERSVGSLRVYCNPMAVVAVVAQVDLRILISILFRGRGLL